MLKVISISTITTHRTTSLRKDVTDFIDANIGDEILFILDKNGNINIRKFKGDVALEAEERYISAAKIGQIGVAITGDVRHAVNADIGDKILWILGKHGNIIIRNTVILEECSRNIFNKDIAALIIGLTIINRQNKTAGIPKEIIDILGLNEGDKIVLSLDEYGNIIVSKEMENNVLEETIITGNDSRIYLTNTVIDILDNTDKILWFFDEEGNITIKNDLLSDNCIKI